MKKLFAIATLIAGTLVMVSCGDDDGGGTTPEGNITISGIPAAAQVAAGDDLSITGVTVQAEDGIATFAVSVDGASTDLTSLVTVGGTESETIDITLGTTGLTTGIKTVIFTLTDADGDTETVQHALTVDAFGIVDVNGSITADVTWSSDNVYVLNTLVFVESGATLTIEAGTIIKGAAGTGANATGLVVTRGGAISANGTAAAPIIMTSVADNIEPGSINSPNLSDEVDGLWGGLIVLGAAKVSDDDGTTISGATAGEVTTQIEGISTDVAGGNFGGLDDADDSGNINYVSVRHGGSNIGEGNEINGITFGGVGSGTEVSHIEVVANQDDGVEFFGGTVDASNVIVWSNGDDAVDTDMAYAGTIDNVVIVNAGDKAFELDGPEGTYVGAGHTIQNATIYMEGCAGGYDDDSGTDVVVNNFFFTGVTEDTGTANDYNVNGTFVATNIQFDVTPVDLDGDSNTPDEAPTAAAYFADMVSAGGVITEVTSGTVGANESAFANWTFTDLNGGI